MKFSGDTIPVCVNCDRNSKTKICKKCGIEYCKDFASKVDILFCANCISDITLKETIIEKEVEHLRTDGSVSFSRKYQARRITMAGVDWLFHNKAIEDSTDLELDASIEYHASIKDLMLMERQSRQLERSRLLAGIKIVHSNRKSQHETERDANKKSKTKEKDITGDVLAKMLLTLMKSGMTLEQIQALAGGKK